MCNREYPIMRTVIILCMVVLLSACGSYPTQPQSTESTIIHPELPQPVAPYQFDWNIIEHEDKPYVALTFDDSLVFRQYLEDILRYIRESNDLLCYYREGNGDPICTNKETDDDQP